jgi:hypothetical protein
MTLLSFRVGTDGLVVCAAERVRLPVWRRVVDVDVDRAFNGSPMTSSSPAAEWWCYEPSPVEGWRPLKSVLPGGGTDSLPA